VRAVAR